MNGIIKKNIFNKWGKYLLWSSRKSFGKF